MSGLRLRPACAADVRMLWEWANDAETRQVSFSTAAIPWETHREWLSVKLADARARFYIAVGEHGDPVAQIRFDLKDDRAVVSVSVAPEERRKGYGACVLRMGAEILWRATEAQIIEAYIKPGNAASVRTFTAAGYARQADCIVNGAPAIYMTLERPRLS